MLRSALPASAREQRADVGQKLVGADGAVAAVFDETIYDLVDAAQLIRVGRLRRSSDLHHVFQVRENLLLNRFFQTLVRVVLEAASLSCVGRDADQNLLTESVLRVLC